MRHGSIIPILAFCLAIGSAAALAMLAYDTRPSRTAHLAIGEHQASAGTSADAAIARAFYAAANETLRSGDSRSLLALLAPGFRLHAEGRAVAATARPDQDRLVEAILALRVTTDQVALGIDELTVAGDRVIARVTPRGTTSGPFNGLSLASRASWGVVDLLDVQDNLVAEFWTIGTMTAAVTVLTATESKMPTSGVIGLGRLNLNPGAVVAGLTNPGPTLLVIEAGQLAVDFGRTEPGFVSIDRGSHYQVPVNTRYDLRNDGTTPVLAVALAMFPHPKPGTVADADQLHRLDISDLRARALFTPDPARRDRDGELGAVSEHLAGGALRDGEGGEVAVTIARVRLGTDEVLPAHELAGMELVAVETGSVIGSETEQATVAGPRGIIASDRASNAARLANDQQMAGSDGGMRGPGAVGAISNATAQPATLLLVTVTSASEVQRPAD